MRRFAIAMIIGVGLLGGCRNVLPEDMEARIEAQRAAKREATRAMRELWVLDTDAGRIVVRLFPQAAPEAVAAVRDWVRRGLYAGTWFHRVQRTPRPFVVQGGDPASAAVDPATDAETRARQAGRFGYGSAEPMVAALTTPRRHAPGAVALAVREDGARAGPQFVIALDHLPHLDDRQPVIGQVVGGWSAVKRLEVGDRIQSAQLLPPEQLSGDWWRDVPPPAP